MAKELIEVSQLEHDLEEALARERETEQMIRDLERMLAEPDTPPVIDTFSNLDRVMDLMDRLLDPTPDVSITVSRLIAEVMHDPESRISSASATMLASIADYHVPRLQDAVND